MDSTLCDRIENEGNVRYGSGACCYPATVNNVNLLTGELTVTFDEPIPPIFEATDTLEQQVISNVVYNCGLCYTNGLGTNMPALAFERGDEVLVLVAKETVTIVGHNYDVVTELKHCGQMGRMIIKPAKTFSGTDGYSSPFILDETDDDGERICLLIGMYFHTTLLAYLARGTQNGEGDLHMMVYAKGENIIIVPSYLFPNGAILDGTLELTSHVNDLFFPYGIRAMQYDSISYLSTIGSLTVSSKVQPSRSIGTNTYAELFPSSLSSTLAMYSMDYISRDSTWDGSPVFGVDENTGDIYIREMAGIMKYATLYDDEDQSVEYSLGNPENSMYLTQDDAVPFRHVNTYKYAKHPVEGGCYSVDIEDSIVPFSLEFVTQTNGVNSLSIKNDIWRDRVRDWTECTAVNVGYEHIDMGNITEYFINGVSIGKAGYNLFKQWDRYIEGTESFHDISGTIEEYDLVFLYLDINAGISVFIRATATISVSPTALSTFTVPVTSTIDLCLYRNGNVTVLDSIEQDCGTITFATYKAVSLYSFDPRTILVRANYDPIGINISPVRAYTTAFDPRCGTYPGDTCDFTGSVEDADFEFNYIIHGPETYKTESISRRRSASFILSPIFTGSPSFKVAWCHRRLAAAVGYASSATAKMRLMFNEYAKSDDGKMLYFSVPKLSAFSNPVGDDNFIRVFINNGEVTFGAETIFEDATGLEHSQADFRFAPYN